MDFTNIVNNGIFTTGFCTLCQSHSYIAICITYHDIFCVNCLKIENQCSHCTEIQCTEADSLQVINMEKIKKQNRSRLYAFTEDEEIEIDEFDLSGLLLDDIDEAES